MRANWAHVNRNSENNPMFFGSNETSGGGSINRLKKKIKNITKKYTMKMSRRKTRQLKRRIKSKYIGRSRSASRSRNGGKTRKQQRGGGYGQFMNNFPNTPSYSLGGILSSAASGLAIPPPFQTHTNSTNCIDNYNHYTKMGTPSSGH